MNISKQVLSPFLMIVTQVIYLISGIKRFKKVDDDLYSWFSGAGSRQTNRIQTEKPQQSRYNLFIFFCISKKLKTDIHIKKQDIRIYIYVAYSRQNAWTEWVEFFFVGTHGWRGCCRLKKSYLVFV